MRVWWRAEPLTELEVQLFGELSRAHHHCTFRNNPSALAVQMAAGGSGSFQQAIAAALLMTGGRHGPLLETYDFLRGPNPASEAGWRLAEGKPVWGWGSSFVKGELDPLLKKVDEVLRQFPIYAVMEGVQRVMDAKQLYPNPSCYTAATALALGVPRESTPWLAVNARLTAWTMIFQTTVDGARE